MKKITVLILAIVLLLSLLACPKKPPGKVSDIVIAARSFATANVALGAFDSVTDILTQDGTVSEDTAQVIFTTSERVLRILDRVSATINNGTWDQASLTVLLDSALAEIAKLESDLGIKNPQSAARVREYLALLRFGINSASQIIQKLKPPALPATPLLDADKNRAKPQSLTLDQTTQIITLGIDVAQKIGSIRSGNAENAWASAAEESKATHKANRTRIK